MPAKNGSATIGKAIKSILFAAPSNAELLIVDDGSSDNTFEILGQLASKDKRIKVYRNEKSLGVAESLNFLVSESRFEFIARMDADDISAPWRLPIQIRALKKNNVDFVFTTAVRFGNTPLRPQRPFSLRPIESALELLFFNPFVHSTMACRKSSIVTLGGYTNCSAEDYELWLRASSSGQRLTRLAIPCLFYRVHSGQVTADSAWIEERQSDKRIVQESKISLERFLKRTNLYAVGEILSLLRQGEKTKIFDFVGQLEVESKRFQVRRRVIEDIKRHIASKSLS